ncbi:IS3 family transposase [Streptomyces canus]|uniref:IS3 family transposase n=1 Tax=Streptomyces canus TaxID=58343 RepID=UPI002780E1D8|nr:IS3 family transposase [Streptomyces canus]MDQ0764994.1 putative transposase [Streptomyces canus]MDQ1066572.1 putative transposase [Streptomyces canus]
MTENEPEALVAFIGRQRAEHNVPHRMSCRLLGVSEAWFYKWRRRSAEPTEREVRRVKLEERIRYFFRASGETYGSPRITLDLWEEGWQVSVNTVAEIMAELGLQGRKPPRRRKSLTRQGKRKAAPDLVRRRFDAVAPDLLWYGDMTEIETDEGKIYLATVIDAFSRRCLGYAMGEHHDAALVGASLKVAAVTRGGSLDGTIFHSDRGAEYTSEAYNKLCDRLGVVQSMGRVGSALDNAAAESFNSLIKVEYIHRRQFATRTEARLKIATWITGFYNPRRRHSAAGGLPPEEFERIIAEARERHCQKDQTA